MEQRLAIASGSKLKDTVAQPAHARVALGTGSFTKIWGMQVRRQRNCVSILYLERMRTPPKFCSLSH